MDAGGTSAPDTGAHPMQNVAPDASDSHDASPATPMDDASQSDDSSTEGEGGDNGLWPDASLLEASAEDAPSVLPDGSASCPNGVVDLSNVGAGDFTVSFSVATMQTGYVALVSQRSACTGGTFWDIRLCVPDAQKRCTVAGSVLVETSSPGEYSFLDSKVAVNDGKVHDVTVARASGVMTLRIDGNLSGSASSKAAFSSLPALQTSTGACVGHDATVALTGTLSSVCITTP
jgi:hypothetical protein